MYQDISIFIPAQMQYFQYRFYHFQFLPHLNFSGEWSSILSLKHSSPSHTHRWPSWLSTICFEVHPYYQISTEYHLHTGYSRFVFRQLWFHLQLSAPVWRCNDSHNTHPCLYTFFNNNFFGFYITTFLK